jgi:hypothetical protein
MAEAEARRRRPLVWPWIAGLLVAAVLIWLLSERLTPPSAGADAGPAGKVREEPVAPPASGPLHVV